MSGGVWPRPRRDRDLARVAPAPGYSLVGAAPAPGRARWGRGITRACRGWGCAIAGRAKHRQWPLAPSRVATGRSRQAPLAPSRVRWGRIPPRAPRARRRPRRAGCAGAGSCRARRGPGGGRAEPGIAAGPRPRPRPDRARPAVAGVRAGDSAPEMQMVRYHGCGTTASHRNANSGSADGARARSPVAHARSRARTARRWHMPPVKVHAIFMKEIKQCGVKETIFAYYRSAFLCVSFPSFLSRTAIPSQKQRAIYSLSGLARRACAADNVLG
jgi:hypothetical protein